MDVLRQDPRSDEGVDAGFPQTLPRNSEMRQFWQPTAVDLHVPNIETAIPFRFRASGLPPDSTLEIALSKADGI